MAVKLNEMEKKLTAVDWLESEIKRRKPTEYLQDLFDQGKQLEKQQIEKTWFDSTMQFDNAAEMTYKKSFEQYYTETYGSERSS